MNNVELNNKVFDDEHQVLLTMMKFLEFQDEMIWIRNQSNDIIFANKAFCNFFGFNKNKNEFGPGNIQASKLLQKIEGPKAETVRINQVLLQIRRVVHNIKGQPKFIIYSAKKPETPLAGFSESLYLKSLLDNIPYQIYFKDRDSRFTLVNYKQAFTLGLNSPEEAIGKSDFDFFSTKHAQITFEDEQKIIKTGRPVFLKTEKIENHDGSVVWMNTTKAAIKNENGESIGIVGISYDITERIIIENNLKTAKEKAEESDRLKTAFLANMSHEIRTPMNGIIGFVNLLKEPEVTENERQEFFIHIESCTQTLLNLIDDIIDISKIESGQINIIKTDFKLLEFLNEIIKTFDETKKTIFDTPVELRTNFPANTKNLKINTDPYRLRQILTNLLNNAFKFTLKGFVETGFTLKNDQVLFYVKDTGMGIPDDKKEIIFERFGQANQSVYISNKGTGLGLSISKNLIQMLDGEIWLESTLNKGSVFYFNIPINSEKTKNSSQNYSWENKTILFTGQFIGYEHRLRDFLHGTGLHILWAENEAEFTGMCQTHSNIDLILLECSELTRQCKSILQKVENLEKRIPVISILSNQSYQESMKLTEPYCCDYLLRPVEKYSLLNKLEKYLKH